MANQSVLELAVGTGKWDSGLKKAQQSLNNFVNASGGLDKALQSENEKISQFVKMMGDMTSKAGTAKGQMNDYKRVLEQLTAQYNSMSDAQKNTIGQDFLQSIDKIKVKFQDAKSQVEEFNRSLGEIKAPEIGTPSGDGGGLFGGLGGKMSGALQVFAGNMMTKAAGALANLGSEMTDMVKQGVELARQGEGIRIAFERLGRGDILQGLRDATHGTVTDLELMKAAVKFNDFKLPLEELGTMLAFAQQKAKDTGQSVDYMVESIVTGLGRKSLMILDNLGLSASEVKERMKETGDMTKAVGDIIREQMAKAGEYVETAADRALQANVSLQNKMEELGRKFEPLQEASNNLWTSMKIGILDIIGGPLTDFINKLTEAGRIANQYGILGGNAKVGRMVSNLANSREENRQSIYQQQQQKIWQYINRRENYMKDRQRWINNQGDEGLRQKLLSEQQSFGTNNVGEIQAQIDAAKKMLADYRQAAKSILAPVKTDIDTSGAEANVDSLKKKLKELENQRKKAITAGDTDLSKSLLKQINQTKADIRGLDPNALKTTGSKKTTDPTARIQQQFDTAMAKANIFAQEIEFPDLTGPSEAWEAFRSAIVEGSKEIGEAMNFTKWTENFNPYAEKMKELKKSSEDLKSSWRAASSAIGSVGSALSGLQDPAINIATVIAQSIATIGLAYAENLAGDNTTKGNIWAFIAAAAASTISLATTIAQFHSATGYAEGGMIKGNSYSGDNLMAMGPSGLVGLNAGEIVLNQAGQRSVAAGLQGSGFGGNMRLVTRLSGSDLLLSIERTGQVKGYGQLMFWKGN